MVIYDNSDLFVMLFLGLLIIYIIIIYKRKKLEARLSLAGMRDIDQMDGIQFEQYLVVLFKRLGYRVKRTPSSNDFGADLILEGEQRIVVQAKRYKNKVGIKAVQEINSAKTYYNAAEAWVITNNFFTSHAIKLAKSADIRLIDRYILADLMLNARS